MEFDSFFMREGRAKKFYPVIHTRNLAQARQNVHIAFQHGADGVFLINHEINSIVTILIAAVIRETWPEKFIGVHLLNKTAEQALELVFRLEQELHALWTNESNINVTSTFRAELIKIILERADWSGYYFVSVAFNHQPAVSDVAMAARNAVSLAHVVVTSGDQNGSPATVERIRAMKKAIPDHPLAIASGITCDNIHLFLPYADIFMVATDISDTHDNLDPRLVERMATIIQNYNKSAGLLA